MTYRDAVGALHQAAAENPRIVSLVPSITELLCTMGLADSLVGRTGFCVHPKERLKPIPKVGGTKDVNLAKLVALAPTHVLVNVDENRKETVEAIARSGAEVIVTHPVAPHDNLGLYRLVGGIFRREQEAESLCAAFVTACADAAAEDFAAEGVLYLIWRNPWMTVARDTYISAMLALVNWQTLPTEASARYPEVSLADVGAELVLLSTEPFSFSAPHVDEVRRITHRRTVLIDGEMISWYGSRAIAGVRYLRTFREALDRKKSSA